MEAILWLAGLLLAFILVSQWAMARSAQVSAMSIGRVKNAVQATPAAGRADAKVDGSFRPDANIIGRLDIPRIQLSVPVVDDYDSAALLRGVGRIGGTAMPGGLGNFVVAGHRDTFFRALRRISRGMDMRVVTSEGTYRYEVDRTEIVTPDQVNVLDIGSRPEMTLITCFPFDYIGAAPKRFVVHAHLLSLDPSAS